MLEKEGVRGRMRGCKQCVWGYNGLSGTWKIPLKMVRIVVGWSLGGGRTTRPVVIVASKLYDPVLVWGGDEGGERGGVSESGWGEWGG